MKALKGLSGGIILALLVCASLPRAGAAQRGGDSEFGPIVRAYLEYLRDQQEVVDDRVSRREIDRRYYLHNSNRIHALRRMAVRIARETDNDYLPELEAVTADEFDLLFDEPPDPRDLREGEVLLYRFRFLGAVPVGRERFYLFARLDPYEQAELKKKAEAEAAKGARAPEQPAAADSATRPRRANSP